MLICPFCNAPYREVVPAGTVHVRCKYCGGTILIPAGAPRCPNHPDVLAVGLCNDCGRSYCDSCLYLSRVQDATLYFCPSCWKRRESGASNAALASGLVAILLGVLLFFIPTVEALTRAFLSIVIGFCLIAFGTYRRSGVPSGVTLRDKREIARVERESRKSWVSQASDFVIYQRLLNEFMREHGAEAGWQVLERKIGSYMQGGLTRSQAVRKLAEEEGY